MVQFCESNLGIWKCFFFGRPTLFLFFSTKGRTFLDFCLLHIFFGRAFSPCFAIRMLSMGEPVRAILIVVSLCLPGQSSDRFLALPGALFLVHWFSSSKWVCMDHSAGRMRCPLGKADCMDRSQQGWGLWWWWGTAGVGSERARDRERWIVRINALGVKWINGSYGCWDEEARGFLWDLDVAPSNSARRSAKPNTKTFASPPISRGCLHYFWWSQWTELDSQKSFKKIIKQRMPFFKNDPWIIVSWQKCSLAALGNYRQKISRLVWKEGVFFCQQAKNKM